MEGGPRHSFLRDIVLFLSSFLVVYLHLDTSLLHTVAYYDVCPPLRATNEACMLTGFCGPMV
jgi:hypothetical protein